MIQKNYQCSRCGSENILKNGKTKQKRQKFVCKACGKYGTLEPKEKYPKEVKEQILQAYQERSSMRGISRTYGISRNTLSSWLKKKALKLPNLEETLLPAEKSDSIELDELWSFVGNKQNDYWVWVALCSRTRQILAFVLGKRDYYSCRQLRQSIPRSYQNSQYYSDKFRPYKHCFAKSQLRQVNKDSGLTNHLERWNNTLRQRIGRFVRKTLSFFQISSRSLLCIAHFYSPI